MDSERVLFIIVGVVIVVGVGQLLIHSGRRYLAGSAPADSAAAGPAASRVAVLLAGVDGVALTQLNRRKDEALIEAELRADQRQDMVASEHEVGLRIRPAESANGGPVGPGGETQVRH